MNRIINKLTGNSLENPLPPNVEFANYFINKIQVIRDNLDCYDKYEPPLRPIQNKLTKFRRIDRAELKSIVMHLKTKSCKLDGIPTRFIKKIFDNFTPVLGLIVNCSLESGDFDASWKMAILCPLIKKLNGDLVRSNYRPVSNLSFISKIVESAGMKQINEYCMFNNLFLEYQSAYRPHKSCETALIKIVNEILWNMEYKRVMILVAMDLSAAFDTVDHSILLKVLNQQFGIDGTPLKWGKSYLENRSFKVCHKTIFRC